MLDTLTIVMIVFVFVEAAQLFAIRGLVKQIYNRVDHLIPEDATSGDMLLGGFISMGLALGEVETDGPKKGQLTERAVLARMAMDNLVGYAGDKLRERLLAGTPMQGMDPDKLPKRAKGAIGVIGFLNDIGLLDRVKSSVGKGAAKTVERAVDAYGR